MVPRKPDIAYSALLPYSSGTEPPCPLGFEATSNDIADKSAILSPSPLGSRIHPKPSPSEKLSLDGHAQDNRTLSYSVVKYPRTTWCNGDSRRT